MMRYFSTIIVVLYFMLGGCFAQPARRLERFDQTSSPDNRSPIPIRVIGQVAFGAVGGIAGALLTKVHPVAGGIGWTFGSSFGVFAMGDQGTGRGSYWWTFTAGAMSALAWTPVMVNGRGLDAGAAVAGAILTSLVSEIVVYHLTEGDGPSQKVKVSFSPSTMQRARQDIQSGEMIYTLSVRVLL
jgi:tryptophan-rich sensory protein